MLDFVRLWDWCSYNSILYDCLSLRWMAKMVASFKPAKYFPASSCCHSMLPQFVQSPEYSHFAIICRVTKIPHTCSCPHDLYFIISTHLSADWASDRKLEKSVWTDRNYYSVSWVWNWGNVCSCWHWWLEQYPCWAISYLMSILFSSSWQLSWWWDFLYTICTHFKHSFCIIYICYTSSFVHMKFPCCSTCCSHVSSHVVPIVISWCIISIYQRC